MTSISSPPAPGICPRPTGTGNVSGNSSSQSDSSIPRIENLSYRDFVHDFQRKRRPVILTDATRDWAARSWTPEQLRQRVGHRDLEIRTESGPQTWRFEDLCDLIVASTEQQPAPYARNVNIKKDLPELWPDVCPRLKYATPDWKSSRLLPRDFVFPNGLEELFFGGTGTSFPRLHVDYWGMDGFVSQLYGRKEFILLGPEQTACVYPNSDDPLSSPISDIDHVDLDRYPLFAQAQPLRVVLQPGETLFNPNGYWHTAVMPEVSLTVITATWNSSNWTAFCRQYRSRGRTRGFTKLATLTWLVGVGTFLGIRDRLI